MQTNISVCLSLVLLLIIAGIGPVSGAINTVPQGGTVFIGEQGLDISAAMDGDTKIGWWASAASISQSSPSNTVQVSSPRSFTVSQSTFGSYPGVWYRMNSSDVVNGSAFTVADPTLAIQVEDTTVNVDVTNKWVPTDDEIRFRIDTNLMPIAGRPGMSSVPVTIKVQDPSGAVYSSLVDSTGASKSIVEYPVTGTPFYTPSLWDTGQRATYPVGTYTIWAECNANSMKDNYNQAGKTVSQKVTLQNQDHNPIISGNYPATTTTKVAVVTPATTIPVTATPVITTSTPTPVITTPVVTTAAPTSPPLTAIPTTTAPAPKPTHTPGFDGAVVMVALSCLLIAYHRIQ